MQRTLRGTRSGRKSEALLMAVIKNVSTGLYLVENGGPNRLVWGAKKDAVRRHRINSEVASRYAQQLRDAGHSVRAETDSGQDLEPAAQQSFVPINQDIDYGSVEWRIDFRRVSAGYLHEWTD